MTKSTSYNFNEIKKEHKRFIESLSTEELINYVQEEY